MGFYTVDVYAINTNYDMARALTNALFHYGVWFAVHPLESNEPGNYEYEIVVERSSKKLLANLYAAERNRQVTPGDSVGILD